jgi:hypothetical protein
VEIASNLINTVDVDHLRKVDISDSKQLRAGSLPLCDLSNRVNLKFQGIFNDVPQDFIGQSESHLLVH